MRAAILSAALLSLSMPFPQDPGEMPPPPPMPGSKAAMDALAAEMQGAWKLKFFEQPALAKERRQEVGFMLVQGDYFSFEMHMNWPSPDNRIVTVTSFSGTHKFELNELGGMTARAVIGSNIDGMGTIHWEEPGKERKYDIICLNDVLTLKRPDGTRFDFDRMEEFKTQRDIYGRPLKLKDPNDPKKPPQEPKKK